jgi:multimeric flavodoxin WrbA
MNKKICIILSSPKEDKSFTLRIAKTLSKNIGDESPEIIKLNSKNIENCTECMKCMVYKKCVINDDIHQIIEEIKKADLLIFASPVTIYNINSKMKLFLERIILWGYKELKGKAGVVVCTADGIGTKSLVDYMRRFFSLSGLLYFGNLYCYIHEFKTYKNINSRFNKQILKIKNTIDKPYRLSFYDYYFYNERKKMLINGEKRYYNEFEYWNKKNMFNENFWVTRQERKINNNFLLFCLSKLFYLIRSLKNIY